MELMEVTVHLSEDAAATVDIIQRTGETFSETVNRILETLLAIAPDLDEHFGPPRDGKGPSGE